MTTKGRLPLYGLLLVRNEEAIIHDTLDHMSAFCDGVFVYDDCSEDATAQICHEHPAVTLVLRSKRPWCDSNRVMEETINRDILLNEARKRIQNECWLAYLDADERLVVDWARFWRDIADRYDAVYMRLWDYYITREDLHSRYDERHWLGPEYRDIMFLFRNSPKLGYSCAIQREATLPRHYRRVLFGDVRHYGKAITVEEWEKTCEYYVTHFPPEYQKKWAARRGKAVHEQSDFGRPLTNWENRNRVGVSIRNLKWPVDDARMKWSTSGCDEQRPSAGGGSH